jgi:hypothetical protein
MVDSEREVDVSIVAQLKESMPITAFSRFSDRLQPNQRSREHFITNTNLNDDNLWVPYATGVWFQPAVLMSLQVDSVWY